MTMNNRNFMYYFTYLLFHLIFRIYEYITEVFNKLWKKLVVIYHVLYNVNTFALPKVLPVHVTVSIGHEEPSKKDLANLVIWCMAANIPYISFYDYKGTLLREEAEFRHIVEKKKQPNDNILWHNSNSEVKNGFIGRKIHVKVLSENDSRDGIVNITKQLAREGVKSIDRPSLNEIIMKQYEFPEPSLALCCGKTFSLWGYPPWPSRITEWFQIKTHHNIDYNQLLDIFWKYSRCEQRYGK